MSPTTAWLRIILLQSHLKTTKQRSELSHSIDLQWKLFNGKLEKDVFGADPNLDGLFG